MRKNKTDARLVSLQAEISTLYFASIAILNEDVKINKDEITMQLNRSPIELAKIAGRADVLRRLLIKHFGYTKERLEEIEKSEFEGKKV